MSKQKKSTVTITTEKKNWRVKYTPVPSVTVVLKNLKDKRRMKDRTILCKQTPYNLNVLRRLDPTLTIETTKKKKKKKTQKLKPLKFLREGLQAYPYQIDGFKFLVKKKKALLADEMGLGKTIQVLIALAFLKDVRPFLVVCPSCAKYNWEDETKKWLGESIYVCEGRKPQPIPEGTQIVVINYDILTYWAKSLTLLRLKGVAADEAHYLKNYKAQRTKTFKKLAAYKDYKFLISGTPVTNKPIEFYGILSMLNPKEFGNYWAFVNKYCDPKNKKGFMDYSGASNLDELYALLTSTVMLRRLKEDVLTQLPPKQRSIQYIPLQNPARYAKIESECTGVLQDIETLRQLSWEESKQGKLEWLDNVVATGEQVLIFFHHKAIANELRERYDDIGVFYTGDVSKKARKKAVDDFMSGRKQIFFGNIKAAGVAITLTRAAIVGFFELPWTPAELDQAEDRVHRISQTRQVIIYYCLAKGTYEVVQYQLLDEKRKVLTELLNGKSISHADFLKMGDTKISRKKLFKRIRKVRAQDEK